MNSKREKHLRREKARIAATDAKHRFGRVPRGEIAVRCDDCRLEQPLRHGRGGMHHDRSRPVAACPQCGGHYGTYV